MAAKKRQLIEERARQAGLALEASEVEEVERLKGERQQWKKEEKKIKLHLQAMQAKLESEKNLLKLYNAGFEIRS